mmetsp:Transcript_40443/g.97620  ORF Transcript_40443/g.97620 Transcript_40443/m.97620 type:complete len:546 (-) Transcript_40443:197-1834(-)
MNILCFVILLIFLASLPVRSFPILSQPSSNERTKLHMAIKSKDLKGATPNDQNAGSIASRLSKAAKEAAEKRGLNGTPMPLPTGMQEDDDSSLSSIAKLAQSIDEELLHPRDGYRPSRETSSIRLLLDHNDSTEADEGLTLSLGCRHVAVVFSKPLSDDQITTEYASRLVSLARLMKYENYRPELICFCGSPLAEGDGLVTATSAGVVFLRHLCSANEISLENTNLCIITQDEDELSWTESSLHPLVQEVIGRGYLKDWLEQSDVYERPTDEYGLMRQRQRKNIHVHLTLVSTDYHLCNLNDIHVRSPRQSPLNALQHKIDHAAKVYKGIAKSTWCFRYATYPYVYSKSEVAAFLGKCYLMSQELRPLLVNLRGVANEGEFFQRDNYRALVGTRRALVGLVEEVNNAFHQTRSNKETTFTTPGNLKAELQKTIVKTPFQDGTMSADVALESALLSLGRCVDLVRPAGTLSATSVSHADWTDAVAKLEYFLDVMQRCCDPDRPLPACDWGKLSLENVKTSFSTTTGLPHSFSHDIILYRYDPNIIS